MCTCTCTYKCTFVYLHVCLYVCVYIAICILYIIFYFSFAAKENPTVSAEIKLETEGENVVQHQRAHHGTYNPALASQAAISDWVKLFRQARDAQGKDLAPLVLSQPTVLPQPVPPLPSINTCMAFTSTTTSLYGPTLPETVSEELQKVKESLVGIGSEAFKPPLNPMNSLVAPPPEETGEPMDCNGTSNDTLTSIPQVVATKESSNISTQSIVVKTADTSSMQVDDVAVKSLEKVSPLSNSGLGPLESAMQVDGTSPNQSSENIADEENSKEINSSIPLENPRHTVENVEEDDVKLLVELFYLPYEHGSRATLMLEQVHWLKSNAYVLHQTKKSKEEKAKVSQEIRRLIFCVQGNKRLICCVQGTRWLIKCVQVLFHYLW